MVSEAVLAACCPAYAVASGLLERPSRHRCWPCGARRCESQHQLIRAFAIGVVGSGCPWHSAASPRAPPSNEAYPDVEMIPVVLDSLNTHVPASLDAAFPAPEARRLVRKLGFHHSPKHGCCPNVAECELGGPCRGPPGTCECSGPRELDLALQRARQGRRLRQMTGDHRGAAPAVRSRRVQAT
jgi:hypothetical protein